MIEQAPIVDDQKPDETPQPETADVGTDLKGTGGPDMGIPRAGGNGSIKGSTGALRGQFDWYAAQVQLTVSEALRRNPATRNASFRLDVRVWPDLTGRITKARLAGSTGDPAVDAAIEQEVLPGLQLQSAPPAEMHLPIVMRFTARRPN